MNNSESPKDSIQLFRLLIDNYCQTSPDIQSSADVLDKKYLKLPKYKREKDLFKWSVNVAIHAHTHKYSVYYFVEKKVAHTSHLLIHDETIDAEYHFISKYDKDMARVISHEYYMTFGWSLTFDHSDESNMARCLAPNLTPSIKFDKNRQPRMIGKINHHRVLQHPYFLPFFNTNNGTQLLLVNITGNDTCHSLGK